MNSPRIIRLLHWNTAITFLVITFNTNMKFFEELRYSFKWYVEIMMGWIGVE